ncbi:hypothetical protein [Hymenobacter sp. YC55]|uniref:hypothetical protein n=1 Tax=Hymenobacter sp. YC55 TaxID=3034019 RepID=UPI0023F9E7A7|nr:hypothetical protein [Hymenobacter sp. YC55]MDF7814229.1 hypothetical protein [Hymenobacter sp. YC55]
MLVRVTESPVFAGLGGGYQRVPGGVKVLGGVGIFRLLAVADMAAVLAHAQVDSGAAQRDAFGVEVVGGGC